MMPHSSIHAVSPRKPPVLVTQKLLFRNLTPAHPMNMFVLMFLSMFSNHKIKDIIPSIISRMLQLLRQPLRFNAHQPCHSPLCPATHNLNKTRCKPLRQPLRCNNHQSCHTHTRNAKQTKKPKPRPRPRKVHKMS